MPVIHPHPWHGVPPVRPLVVGVTPDLSVAVVGHRAHETSSGAVGTGAAA